MQRVMGSRDGKDVPRSVFYTEDEMRRSDWSGQSVQQLQSRDWVRGSKTKVTQMGPAARLSSAKLVGSLRSSLPRVDCEHRSLDSRKRKGFRETERTTVVLAASAGMMVRDDSILEARARVWKRLMEEEPFQPATNWLRAIELPVLAASLPAEGLGLDVGCGDGALTSILSELVAGRRRLVGIDFDAAEASLASGTGGYAHVVISRADRIPLLDASFDFAFANSVLEHIPALSAALAEIARCLKPGGLFLATVPSPQFHDCLLGPGWMRRMTRQEYLKEIDERLMHFHYWSPERWSSELGAVGLQPGPISWYLSRAQVQIWERWSNRTGGLLYWLFRGRHRPIEIQRALGLRGVNPRLMRSLGSLIARSVRRRAWSQSETDADLNGCLLVRAWKPIA
jgi:SAM-dependent methyltransferase